jgi:hypothetical protein
LKFPESHLNGFQLIFKQILERPSTGGVPTRPLRVDMYQFSDTFVANDWSKNQNPKPRIIRTR